MIARLGGASLVLALVLAPGAWAQTDLWELGHPDAKLLMGIDLKGLRDSAAGQALRSQWNAQPQQLGPAGMAMGFLEQIDRVFISSPSLEPSAGTVAGKTPGKTPGKTLAAPANPPFLAVVEGTLPLQQLLAFLPGTAAHRYHDVDVYRGAKATDASIAMLDARTIVLGDEKSVLGAIDRRGRALPPASAILERAQALAATDQFWLIADTSLSRFEPKGAGIPNQVAEKIASEVKGMDVGMSVRDGFQFEMSLATESDATAAQLSKLLSAQITRAMASVPNNPQAEEMAKRLHVDTDGPRLRLSMAMTSEEVAQQVRGMQAAMAARAAAPGAGNAGRQGTVRINGQPISPALVQPAPPQRAAPGKVKIYGLDGGVREIQLSH